MTKKLPTIIATITALLCSAESLPVFAENTKEYLHTIDPGRRREVALRELSGLIYRDPKFVTARATRARWLSEAGNWRDAAKDYEFLSNLQPNSATWPLSHGRCLVKAGQREQALVLYRRAYSIAPKEIAIARDIAVCLAELRQFQESLDWYHQCVAALPSNKDLRVELGYVLRNLGRNKEAQQELSYAQNLIIRNMEENASSRMRNLDLLARVADELREAGGKREAGELVKVMTQHYPSAISFYAAAVHNLAMENFQQCIADSAECLRLDPKFQRVHYLSARSNFRLARYSAALEDSRQARAVRDLELPADILSVRILMTQQRWEEAYRLCEQISIRNKTDSAPHLFAVDCLIHLQRSDRFAIARRHLLMASAAPNCAQREIALATAEFGMTGPAYLVSLNKLVEKYPNRWQAYTARANYFVAQKRYRDALADFQKSVETGCDDPTVFMRRSSLYENALLPDRALKDANRAIELAPSLAEAYKQRAHVYKFLMDRPDLARKDVAHAHSLGRNRPR